MNLSEYMKAVYESELDGSSKAILVYYGYRKHWKNNGYVWVSAETVSSGTGVGLRTVERRIPQLRDAGWLIDTGQRKPNGKGRPSVVYDVAVGTTFTATETGKVQDFTATQAAKSPNLTVTEAVKVEDFTATAEGLSRQIDGTLPPNRQTFTVTVAEELERELDMKQKEEQETVSDAAASSTTPPNLSLGGGGVVEKNLQTFSNFKSFKRLQKDERVWDSLRSLVLESEEELNHAHLNKLMGQVLAELRQAG